MHGSPQVRSHLGAAVVGGTVMGGAAAGLEGRSAGLLEGSTARERRHRRTECTVVRPHILPGLQLSRRCEVFNNTFVEQGNQGVLCFGNTR